MYNCKVKLEEKNRRRLGSPADVIKCNLEIKFLFNFRSAQRIQIKYLIKAVSLIQYINRLHVRTVCTCEPIIYILIVYYNWKRQYQIALQITRKGVKNNKIKK